MIIILSMIIPLKYIIHDNPNLCIITFSVFDHNGAIELVIQQSICHCATLPKQLLQNKPLVTPDPRRTYFRTRVAIAAFPAASPLPSCRSKMTGPYGAAWCRCDCHGPSPRSKFQGARQSAATPIGPWFISLTIPMTDPWCWYIC